MASRRYSGSIRKLTSGRYQARVRDRATGSMISLGTFATKADADLAVQRADTGIASGRWVNPSGGKALLAEYALAWLAQQAGLAPRTREIYASLLRIHILPTLGKVPLNRLDPATIRTWHRSRLEGSSPSMAPKAYRLLRTILSTAVDDELIARNPCRIRAAGIDRPDERRVISIPELYAIADAAPDRYRVLILLAGLAGFRAGELFALTRADVNLEAHTVRIDKQRVRLDSGEVVVAAPKTRAGRRTVTVPAAIVPELERHLAAHVGPEAGAPLFTAQYGAPLDRTNFRQRVWLPAVEAAGVGQLRLHDLRHTAATLAATTGASTKELMARMGHASSRAALIYQHATEDRDRAIAEALSELVDRAGVVDPEE
jgi:integrase